jgi:hypothetical protein
MSNPKRKASDHPDGGGNASSAASALKKPKPSVNNSPEQDAECKRLFYNIFAVGDRVGEDAKYVPHRTIRDRHAQVLSDVKTKNGVLSSFGELLKTVDVVKIMLGYADDTPVVWKYFGGAFLGRLLSVQLFLDTGRVGTPSATTPLIKKPCRSLQLSVWPQQCMSSILELLDWYLSVDEFYFTRTEAEEADAQELADAVVQSAHLMADTVNGQSAVNRVLSTPLAIENHGRPMNELPLFFLVSGRHVRADVLRTTHTTIALWPADIKLRTMNINGDWPQASHLDFGTGRDTIDVAYEKPDSIDLIAQELQDGLKAHFKREKSDSIWYKLILIARLFRDPYVIVL